MMNYVKRLKLKEMIKQALKEDIGKGDITTRLFVPKQVAVEAVIVARENGVLCGVAVAQEVFKSLDKRTKFFPLVKDGDPVKNGQALIRMRGLAVNILPGERVVLNFLGFLSGIATRTRSLVRQLNSRKVKILDTRKTIPTLRHLEKYAVKTGGGFNHRFSLDEMVILKDNHLKVIGDRLWVTGLKKIRNKISPQIKIEVEVKTIPEFKKACQINPDIIMLDNMSVENIRKAVRLRRKTSTNLSKLKPPLLEASGVLEKNLIPLANSGIDFISLGTLTKDVQALDMSLEIIEPSGCFSARRAHP